MDFITREASPFLQTQPFQKAHNGTKTAMNGAELPVKISKISASSQSSASQDSSSIQTPKVSQPSSKILDKVRVFEEQRQSSDIPKVSSSRLSWRFNRASSCNSEDGRSKAGKPHDNSMSDVALKRSFFKQKASSLEEQATYVEKSFQSKFSEELHRIKKLVGKSNIKKAFSVDQLVPQSTGNIASVPAQVMQKVEDSRVKKHTNSNDFPASVLPKEESPELLKKKPPEDSKQHEGKAHTDLTENQCRKTSKPRRLLDRKVVNENVAFSKIPGQCSPRVPRTNVSCKSPVEIPPALPMQVGLVQAPLKPPRLFGSVSTLPKSFKEREEGKDSSLAPKVTIPTIMVENKPVDEDADKAESGQKEANRNEGKTARRNRGITSSSQKVF